MTELLSCIFVFLIMAMEAAGLLLEFRSYNLYKNYFDERTRWYQSRRKENAVTVEKNSSKARTGLPTTPNTVTAVAGNVPEQSIKGTTVEQGRGD